MAINKGVTNHVGYENNKAKHAIIVADAKIAIAAFNLVDDNSGKTVLYRQTGV